MLWFDKAAQYQTVSEEDIGKKRLDSMYQFVRVMPVQYVESRLIHELDEVRKAELKLKKRRLALESKLGQLRGAPNNI